ncbi:MAG: restriction endonuclease [Sedimentisphaerales bacterium]
MKNNKKPKWRRFEEAVASIQKNFAPNARITHDEKILGKSNTERQIDIVVRYNIGQFSVLVIVDCKDWKNPVDIADIGQFIDMFEDVGANKGALICNAGFTDGAKNRAKEKGIDLFRVVDTENPDIKLKIGLPALCDFRYIKTLNFCFRHSAPTPFKMPACDPRYLEIYKQDHSFNDLLLNLLIKAWNSGKLPQEVGEHKNLEFNEEDAYTRVGRAFYGPVEITARVVVNRKLFFGNIPLEKVQGFANEITDSFTTNSFEFGLDVVEVENKWRRLSTENELAVRPTFTFRGIDCYPIIEYKLPIT